MVSTAGTAGPGPVAELDPRFSAEDAAPVPWAEALAALEAAEVFWLSTVRPDGRPHVTPLLAVWLDGALHFCTGPDERKARNLARNAHCALTTGTNTLREGLDLVVEGEAVRLYDDAVLRRLADRYEDKYGPDWRFTVRDGAFHSAEGGEAHVHRVAPAVAFGFAKGTYGQTRWRF
ncbi:MAG TPA: pyridoxamine 5'-phosphate oxidase family protein [Streptomyces sp.]|uniref:pyridoxamine 5'-phosphate oxidase family protein n=1 Tax=Streptomyces sp. TaxID=1931 RepID=UPI002D37A3DF|nr:pyridoxamine 5'-phosphate oxidase family protein [Streptomyces sp.]HZG05417.1 pyridoxamine 5'-phosphate oxidase family protein [Streptomyces sp.]